MGSFMRLLAVLLFLPALAFAQGAPPNYGPSAGPCPPYVANGGNTAIGACARAAQTVNVADYGAVADYQLLSSNYTISASSAALTASGNVFTSAMVGKAIVLPGAGVAGAALITTIQAYTSATAVTLAATASTQLSDASYPVIVGTDNAASINTAVSAAKALTFSTNSSGATNIVADLHFPQGAYLVLSGLNFTAIQTNGFTIGRYGAQIIGATNGAAVIDALGSAFIRWRGLNCRGAQYAEPTTCIQIGRDNTTSLNSSDNQSFQDITMGGYESVAAFYNMNAEQTSYRHFYAFNTDTGSSYAAIFDGINHFGLTSAFVTLSQPANTAQSFNSNTCVDCIFQGTTPLWISGATDLQIIGSYAVITNSSTPTYAANLYTISGSEIKQLNFDVHVETGVGTYNSTFFIDGTSTAPTIQSLRYRDGFSYAGSSIFKADTNQSAISLYGLDLEISSFSSGATPVVDTPSLYSGYAIIMDLPSPASYNLSAFSSQPCYQSNAGCVSNYALPVPLNVSAISPTGVVVALNRTSGGIYYTQTVPYTPTLVIGAPPAGGTQATGVVSSLVLNGEGALGAGGTGYVNGNTCNVTDTNSVLLYQTTITASGGVITAISGTPSGAVTLTQMPVLPISVTGCPGGGSGATITATNYRINISGGLTVTNGGSGYLSAPSVAFSTFGQQTAPVATTTISSVLSLGTSGSQEIFVGTPVTGATKFTTSGCSISATAGSGAVGTYTSGTTGTCTAVITINGATGMTAPTGWNCDAQDWITPADAQLQTASSTTTATISGTTVSGDVIHFKCQGY